MPGLPNDIFNKCRQVLLNCNEFNSYQILRAVFNTNELSPFINLIPMANTPAELVDLCISFLLNQKLPGGHPILPIFIATLRDKYKVMNDTFRYNELQSLYDLVDSVMPNTEQKSFIKILHLSDIHMTENSVPISMFQPLYADLKDKTDGLGLEYLDYLVISGDISNCASIQEFEKAKEFVQYIIDNFKVTPNHLVIVPGNHDLDWKEPVYDWKEKHPHDAIDLTNGIYVIQNKKVGVRNNNYPNRFKNFSKHFYLPLTGQEYPLSFEEQCNSFLYNDSRLQFFALNSAWEIDEFYKTRASIHQAAISHCLLKADQRISNEISTGQLPSNASTLRIAVWHHPVTGTEQMADTGFLDLLKQANVRLGLHGHIHENAAELIGYLHPTKKIHISGAGSFGVPIKKLPNPIPRLYNVVEVAKDHSLVKVHTRCLRKDTGAWDGYAIWPGDANSKRTYYEIKLNNLR